jgi:hypothetical protein
MYIYIYMYVCMYTYQLLEVGPPVSVLREPPQQLVASVQGGSG